MKLLAMFLAIFTIFEANASLTLKPMWRESYGGEADIAEFKSIAYEVFKNLPASEYARFENRTKESIEETIKNSVVTCKDDLVLDGVKKDAINYPLRSPQEIYLGCTSWKTSTFQKKMSLTIHEYLFLLFVDDTGYDVSAQIIEAYTTNNFDQNKESLLNNTFTSCDVNNYKALVSQITFTQLSIMITFEKMISLIDKPCMILRELVKGGYTKGYEQALYDHMIDYVSQNLKLINVDYSKYPKDSIERDPNYIDILSSKILRAGALFQGKLINFDELKMTPDLYSKAFSEKYRAKYGACLSSSTLLHSLAFEYSKSPSLTVLNSRLYDLYDVFSQSGYSQIKKNECGLTPQDLINMGNK